MSVTESNVSVAVGTIQFDAWQGVEFLRRCMAGKGSKLTDGDEEKLSARLAAYYADLHKVADAKSLGLKKQLQLAKKLLLHSFGGRLCAVLRAVYRCGVSCSLRQVYQLATELTVWVPLTEMVTVHWISKEAGPGYRPIVVSGPMRRAQAYMIRDMLSVTGIDNELDFSSKGGGGEKSLIQNICKDIESGYNWWWTSDVKNCFGSILPGHLGWLPVDRRLLKNVMFLPKCAKIKVAKHKDAEQIVQFLYAKYPDLPVSEDTSISVDVLLHKLSVHIVRQGLLQGSVLSPLLARSVIKRELNAALSGIEIKRYSYSDDLSIGAQSKEVCQAARQAVTKHFLSLPAGPIELHDARVRSASSRRLKTLGYLLDPDNGHGDNPVHVKPARKRIEKFKRRLFAKLVNAQEDEDPFYIAETYRRHWFHGQPAWTKVPEWSDAVSSSITTSYVDDYLHNKPMGVWKANKPKLSKIG